MALLPCDPRDAAAQRALSDERLRLNAAVQVELKLKTPRRDGTTHLVISLLEFMQRLRRIRFHGVPAPNAKLRPTAVRVVNQSKGWCESGAAALR